MNSPLEYNGVPAGLQRIQGIDAIVYNSETGLGLLEPPAILTLCSWCNQALTSKLTEAGYTVSHSICNACSEKVLPKTITKLDCVAVEGCKSSGETVEKI